MNGTDQFTYAPDLEEMARQIVEKYDRVGYIDIDRVLFLRDITGLPGRVLAICQKLIGKPIQFFTKMEWCIVVYENRTDYMSNNQMKVLILHELMHIPPVGDKVIDHTVKDFKEMLNIDLDWSKNNQDIPDILMP